MSHSKTDRQPLHERFPELSRWLIACNTCGRIGRDPGTDWATFQPDGFGSWVREDFTKSYDVLHLDATGRCKDCAARTSQRTR